MPHSLDQIFPSLESLGLWTYWVIALFAMLEAVVLTGIVVPGTLVVIAGGMLAQRGTIDFIDMMWFVAAGAVIGAEISFRLGRLASHGRSEASTLRQSSHAHHAAALLQRYGGFAMVAGRFFGPLAAFVPFSAALAGMSHRRFTLWNLISAVPYAVILPVIGYFSGRIIGTLGAAAPRILAVTVMAALALVFLWFVVARIWRAIPLLARIGHSLASHIAQRPVVRRVIGRYPRLSGFLAARFGTERFLGLTVTVLTALLVYIIGAWADSVFEFLGSPDVVSADSRIANVLYAMRDPHLVAILGWVTDVGGRHGVIPMLAGVSAGLLILRRFDLFTGLWIAAIGNQLIVTLLKALFARPRSGLGYYVETSGSFPSGHAAASVAVWAMLFYLAWRLRLLSALGACLAAVTFAFLVGLSRIYLVEHYLSVVLNGYLVGGAWLILGVAYCEWRRRVPHAAPTLLRQWGAAACVVTAMMGTGYLAVTTSNPLNAAPDQVIGTIGQPAELLTTADLPTTTETLTGQMRQPINLIVTAPDAVTLTDMMQKGGWLDAPRPRIIKLAGAFIDDWTGRALPMPLVIPTFWDEHPSKLGFALPDDRAQSERLHVRFWDSHYRTPAGEVVFLGTLTREDPLEWAV
ncbi:MAG: LssY C-terminal domain-containing protein, partial [Paracoccus sp. (in: a-proteobacteria)]|nr:LssY C-terminal domain-containing protein [Paracoccus sp. (in: a-proteobacteria)]